MGRTGGPHDDVEGTAFEAMKEYIRFRKGLETQTPGKSPESLKN
jgi:hypothetical protein